MTKDKESPESTIFDSFVPADWASYQKMLDAHERAAWMEGYLAAKREALQDFVNQSRQVEKGNP